MAQLEFDPFRSAGAAAPAYVTSSGLKADTAHIAHRAVMVGDLLVELRALSGARLFIDEWSALSRNAIEPNVFLEPAVLLTAEQHLPETAGHHVAMVWGPRGGEERRLLALWALMPVRSAMAASLTRGLTHRYASSGAPLLDQQFALEAAAALLMGLRTLDPASSGVMFGELALDGAVARIMRAAALLNGQPTSEIAVHNRACVWPSDIVSASVPNQIAGKARRELNRQARGLSRHGDVRLVKAESPDSIKLALEVFLALEASGWKAKRGTSILSQTRDASFYRMMSRALGRTGQMAVHLLEVGARTAAAGLVLKSGTHQWYVKTTYDETLAEHGPGSLLSHLIGQGCAETTGYEFVDSCAIPGQKMIERVWSGRVRIGDLVIAFGPGADSAIGRELASRRTRETVKQFYYQMRGWPMP